jgi:hypothetical protein
MHAFRHTYASVLLDAGESIKALSEYPGHSDPGFTLPTYTHQLPSSETRTRKAIDDALTETQAEAEDNGNDPPADQGTSAPPPKPMCPQYALAARQPLRGHEKGEVRRPRPNPTKLQVTARQGNKADAPPHAADG